MKKTFILITVAMLTFAGKAYAEMSYGVTASLTKISASGTETENQERNNADVDNTVVIPSVFVEYAFTDTVSLGLDYIPLTADVSDKTKKRTDTETSVAGTNASTSLTRNQSANAELENHITLYSNYQMNDTLYAKVGVAFVTLNTTESLPTGAKYGNEDIYGGVFGIGAADGPHRFEIVYTDYEDISITSSVARTGVTGNNKIEADLDTMAFRYSYAF